MKINLIDDDMKTIQYKLSFTRERHGSLYDRGAADSYYGRKMEPHWYPNGSYNDPKITDLDSDQIAEYNAGYEFNEKHGDKKN
jgi:hypothetical protein